MLIITGECPGKPMRILMISDQRRPPTSLTDFLKKHSDEWWEVALEQLQEQELWQKRQPNLVVAGLPLEDGHGRLIRDLQAQLSFSVLIHCSDLNLQMLETAQLTQPQAILVHPVTEPQLIATLHLIRLSQYTLGENKLQILSTREREVLQWILKGFTSKEIGQRLFVSMNTVNTHKRRIKEKLGVRRWVEVR